ncbi:hypothetical protein RND81_11G010400 [Saponaria officinalis]|uniref:RRM domain-containing protein n=1 Tax=Saponaria officinalis TaxID=3572 RepID=A0AAW1HGS8_SAPOF
MDPPAEEQIDFGDGDYGSSHKLQYQGSGTIPALAEEEMMGDDDDYEDLYDGVNVGEAFSLYHQPEPPAAANMGNGGHQAQTYHVPEPRRDAGVSQNAGSSVPPADGRYQNAGVGGNTGFQVPDSGVRNGASGNTGFQVPMSQKPAVNISDVSKANNPVLGGSMGVQEIPNNQMAVNANQSMNHGGMDDNIIRPQVDNGPTMLFVGELHWWTTDVEIESVLSQYGKVKEVKFFDERASGKSKGYCQVEFYDSVAAASCKEGMNGYMFNGRACVVTFASPQTLKQMGTAYANKNPQQPQPLNQGRRNVNDGPVRGGSNYPAGDGGRNFGRTGWRGGNQNAPGRGPGGGGVGGGPRGRGGFMGPRNSLGNAAGMGGGSMGNFSQGLGGPGFGGPGGGMVPPQGMMGPGFDPTFMGRGGYGGFPGPGFPGIMPPFQAVNPMGLTGVAPHVNPAFFNRGMAPNGMGMMGNTGMEGHPGGMWGDPSMGGWGGEEHDQRTRESSYGGGDDVASEYGYGEGNPEKTTRTTAPPPREKERVSERDYSGTSDRRYRDEREQDWDRSDRDRKYRDEKGSYREHRHKERDSGYEDDWDKGQSSSRSRSRSRAVAEDDHRSSRSRDADYGKRRRAPSE